LKFFIISKATEESSLEKIHIHLKNIIL
jgi:hypothetical protein